MKKLIGLLVGLVFCIGAAAQDTTVTASSITDSDGTLWANGIVSVQFVPNPSTPNPGSYKLCASGAALSPGILNQPPVNLGGSAGFSVTTYDNSQVCPSGSQWQFTVCPNASSKCGIITTPVSGTTQNITTQVDAGIPAPRFIAVPINFGYADIEAQLQLTPGGLYYNVPDACYRQFSGSSFSCIGNGGGLPAGCSSPGTGDLVCTGTLTLGPSSTNTVTVGPQSTPPASWVFDWTTPLSALTSIGGISSTSTSAQTLQGPLCQTLAYIDVIGCFNAIPDAITTNDAVMASGSAILTSATANFNAASVGKTMSVQLLTGQMLITTIVSVQSNVEVTLAASNPGGALTASTMYFGTDNRAAIQSAIDTTNFSASAEEFDQEIYFSHGYCSTCTGSYLINGTIQLANSALNLNKRFTFIGDGPGITRLQEVNPTVNMIQVTDQGQAGVQNTFENLGFFGVANTQSNFAAAIAGNQTTGIRAINNWFSSWRVAIANSENTSNQAGGEFYLENNVFEFVWAAFVSTGSSSTPGAPGQARDITIHGGEIASSNPQSQAAALFAIDITDTNRVIISDVAFNFGVGHSVRCIGCTSFDMHDNDFSETNLSGVGEEFGAQNLFLQNTVGNIHHNQFASTFTEAVDIAGGNNISFSGNTYNVTDTPAAGAVFISGTNNSVLMSGENFISCATVSLCLNIINTSVLPGSNFVDNLFPVSIANPVLVNGGTIPTGVNVQLFNGSTAFGIFTSSTSTPESIMQSEVASDQLFVAGQITTSSPKQCLLENNPSANSFSLDCIQQGGATAQTLKINPTGGPIALSGESTNFPTFLACYTSTGIGHCTTAPTGAPPTCGCVTP
jgi:hypothetical protein